jgi:hypothetical protein
MDIRAAKYTKIGNMVTVYVDMRTSNVDTTGASGNLLIGGLPFSVVGTAGGIAIGLVGAFGASPDGGSFLNATTQIRLTKTNASAFFAVADLTTGALANRNNIIFTGTYLI